MLGQHTAGSGLYGDIGADARLVRGLEDLVQQAVQELSAELGITKIADRKFSIICDRGGMVRLAANFRIANDAGGEKFLVADEWCHVRLIAGDNDDMFYVTLIYFAGGGQEAVDSTWELVVPPDGLDSQQSQVYAILRRQNLAASAARDAAIASLIDHRTLEGQVA